MKIVYLFLLLPCRPVALEYLGRIRQELVLPLIDHRLRNIVLLHYLGDCHLIAYGSQRHLRLELCRELSLHLFSHFLIAKLRIFFRISVV